MASTLKMSSKVLQTSSASFLYDTIVARIIILRIDATHYPLESTNLCKFLVIPFYLRNIYGLVSFHCATFYNIGRNKILHYKHSFVIESKIRGKIRYSSTILYETFYKRRSRTSRLLNFIKEDFQILYHNLR